MELFSQQVKRRNDQLDHWYNNSRILMKQELLMQFKLEYREAIARRETMLKNNLEKINSDLCTGVNDILNCYELTTFEEILSCETVTDSLLLHHF